MTGGVKNVYMRSKQPSEVAATTADRVLAVAEAVFSEKGQDKGSLREITSRAGVNLAAVGYHFGSKEALASEVFARLASRVNKARVAQLDVYLAGGASGRRPDVAKIVSIFLQPYLGEGSERSGLLMARFILQHRLSPTAMSKKIIARHFDPMARRFIEGLAQACPDLSSADLHWRYSFMVSTVVLTITDRSKDNRLARLSNGLVDATRTDVMREALIGFLVGALAAPSPPKR